MSDAATTIGTIVTLAGGGGIGLLGRAGFEWLRDRQGSAMKVAEHRDGLTFDLLDAAREEMGVLRQEVSDLRNLTAKAAHIEEALDHIHALLHAEGEAELRAAARRATAFLKRMRPDPADLKGTRRNEVQIDISAARITKDAKGDEK